MVSVSKRTKNLLLIYKTICMVSHFWNIARLWVQSMLLVHTRYWDLSHNIVRTVPADFLVSVVLLAMLTVGSFCMQIMHPLGCIGAL